MNPICPYCNNESKLVDSEVVYGRSYGMMYLCKPCDAYVGCHHEGNRPLGTLANRSLREMRKKAHAAFDPLWRGKPGQRKKSYKLLADYMGIKVQDCHIGMFNEEQCQEVIDIAKKGF